MKFIHLSDLHLGKRLNEFSLIEDQEFVLQEIYSIISEEKPDFVIIAGDVYDKPVPSAEAVKLFDGFLTRDFDGAFRAMGLPVLQQFADHDPLGERFTGGLLLDVPQGHPLVFIRKGKENGLIVNLPLQHGGLCPHVIFHPTR